MNTEEKMKCLDIFLKDALYTEYNIEDFNDDELLNVLFHHERFSLADKLKTIDSYCNICKKNTTFLSKETDENVLKNMISESNLFESRMEQVAISASLTGVLENIGTFQRNFRCPRPESNSAHDLIFIFRIKDSKLIKIGQNPSLADLARVEIEKYRELNENIYQELNRAIGLSSHGIGVGSFVYLRRIIEKHIVLPKLHDLLEGQKITQEDIFQTDFKKKIELAKDQLPDFLVNNKKIYSILSKGIHELEEKECKDFFPILRASIEIILDEKIEKKMREEKNKLIARELNKFE